MGHRHRIESKRLDKICNSKRIDHTDINLNPSFTSLFLTDYVMPVSDLDLGFLAQMLQPIMLLIKPDKKDMSSVLDTQLEDTIKGYINYEGVQRGAFEEDRPADPRLSTCGHPPLASLPPLN